MANENIPTMTPENYPWEEINVDYDYHPSNTNFKDLICTTTACTTFLAGLAWIAGSADPQMFQTGVMMAGFGGVYLGGRYNGIKKATSERKL